MHEQVLDEEGRNQKQVRKSYNKGWEDYGYYNDFYDSISQNIFGFICGVRHAALSGPFVDFQQGK